MNRLLSTVFSLICLISFGQLEPEFHGTYMAEDESASLTVYTMDEVVEDCFLVDYEVYENFALIMSMSGYGSCDGPNGHWLMRFDETGLNLEVEFTRQNGVPVIILHDPGGKTFFYRIDEEIETTEDADGLEEYLEEYEEGMDEEGAEEEFFFAREDGAELLLFNDNEQIGFLLTGVLTEKCQSNDITGVMIPLDEELTIFEFKTAQGCRIEFQMSSDSINIVEEKCGALHNSGCGTWSGLYVLGQ